MARVDPPAPVHTRPYGPARRPVILRYDGPIDRATADEARALIRAIAPALEVVFVDDRVTVLYPLPNHESTAP